MEKNITAGRLLQMPYWNWTPGLEQTINKQGATRVPDWVPLILIPILAAIMLISSVFLLIIFRHNPALVITTVAGCLVIVTIYLTFTTVGTVSETFA